MEMDFPNSHSYWRTLVIPSGRPALLLHLGSPTPKDRDDPCHRRPLNLPATHWLVVCSRLLPRWVVTSSDSIERTRRCRENSASAHTMRTDGGTGLTSGQANNRPMDCGAFAFVWRFPSLSSLFFSPFSQCLYEILRIASASIRNAPLLTAHSISDLM